MFPELCAAPKSFPSTWFSAPGLVSPGLGLGLLVFPSPLLLPVRSLAGFMGLTWSLAGVPCKLRTAGVMCCLETKVGLGIKRPPLGPVTDQPLSSWLVTLPFPLLQAAHSPGRNICFSGTLPGHAVPSHLEVPHVDTQCQPGEHQLPWIHWGMAEEDPRGIGVSGWGERNGVVLNRGSWVDSFVQHSLFNSLLSKIPGLKILGPCLIQFYHPGKETSGLEAGSEVWPCSRLAYLNDR